MELSFRCDDPLPQPDVEVAIKVKVITAKITNITADGNVTITFSSRLQVPKVNLTEFSSLNVTIDGKNIPALELSVNPGLETTKKYF